MKSVFTSIPLFYSMLADKLNMTPKDAERWIVNLIRQAKLDAKIDSQQGHVVMGTQAVSPYQQLIEKTKTLSFRTQMLAINVEKKAQARYSEVGRFLDIYKMNDETIWENVSVSCMFICMYEYTENYHEFKSVHLYFMKVSMVLEN